MPIQKEVKCAQDGGLSLLHGVDETVAHTQNHTKCILAGHDYGDGTLYVTSKRVVWLPSSSSKGGLALDYSSLILHAVSKDSGSYTSPCIYCQLDADKFDLHSENNRNESRNKEEIEDDTYEGNEILEMNFCPADTGSLTMIFKVMSEMASLNPNSNEIEECDSDEDDLLPMEPQRWTNSENDENVDDILEDADENNSYDLNFYSLNELSNNHQACQNTGMEPENN